MIKIYSARENVDKERFIYENISGEAFVLVPDQYTLVAEEQALKYLDTDCLLNIEILSINRLGQRVLHEQGLDAVNVLDQYGRFMLLNRIINANRDRMHVYAKSAGKTSFTQMLSDFISAFKQQECSIDEIKSMLSDDETDELLAKKMEELKLIIEEYENSLGEKYIDAEDFITRYIKAITKSEMFNDREIWIYGYDSYTPKMLTAIDELSKKAKIVNLVINESDFGLHEIFNNAIHIDKPVLKKSETISKIERGLFADEIGDENFIPEDLKIVRASNQYFEAESAAAYVYHLIRDLGYQMKDIQIIANDGDKMQAIISRTFMEYGLPVFLDQARKITDSAPVAFIMNLLYFVKYGKTEALLSALKTGLSEIEYDDIEELENYARNYKIRGSMWKKPFQYGAKDTNIGEQKFAHLEILRQGIASKLEELDNITKKTTVRGFVSEFKTYLISSLDIENRLQKFIDVQLEKDLYDEAQRTAQSYQKAMEILDQSVEIMGDEKFELSEFSEIYLSGLKSVEVGVIPPTLDGLSMGTMIRTRPRPCKAVIVLGANEDILPLQSSPSELFSAGEKDFFIKKGFAFGKLDDIKNKEENIAMYRMLSKPSEKLYISYSLVDAGGSDMQPSIIIDNLMELFPAIKKNNLIERDVISMGWRNEMINSPDEAMRHLTNHLKNGLLTRVDPLSEALLQWFKDNRKEQMQDIMNILEDENDPSPLGKELAKSLYAKNGDLVLSASSINKYFECPFRYFIDNGLKLREERKFQSDPRSIGDVYHEFLMDLARQIVGDRAFGKKLLICSNDELQRIVSAGLDKIAENYQGGLFISNGNEEYRMSMIKEIAALATRAIAEQLTADSLIDADFEANMAKGNKFNAIEMDVDGTHVLVEGKIDRADILTENRVRIIDYKTGTDKLDTWKMAQGYKMQLMIYMISATSKEYEAAGMFYFNIRDEVKKFDNYKAEDEMKETDEFKLKGKFINKPGILESMPQEVLAGQRKTGIEVDEYESLRDSVLKSISIVATGISNGLIEIRPLKNDSRLVCSYCNYKAICKRDRTFVRNTCREFIAKGKNK